MYSIEIEQLIVDLLKIEFENHIYFQLNNSDEIKSIDCKPRINDK